MSGNTKKTWRLGQIGRIISPLLIVMLIGSWSNAHAEISIVEITPHTFPDAVANPNQTARMRVTWKGDLKGVRNTQVVGDVYNAGEFLLTSDSDKTFTVNITNNADLAGAELKTFQFRYQKKTYTQFPTSGLANPGTGETALVGMRIVWNKAIGAGDITPSYTITLTEDP